MELHRGNHFLRLDIRSSWIHLQLGSSVQIFIVLAFGAILFTFSHVKLSLKLSLKLIEFRWKKSSSLRLLKNVKNFVNATSMESCFDMPTFYIVFCYYQLLTFIKNINNRGQNLWNNVKKSSKIGQDNKTLKSVFA